MMCIFIIFSAVSVSSLISFTALQSQSLVSDCNMWVCIHLLNDGVHVLLSCLKVAVTSYVMWVCKYSV